LSGARVSFTATPIGEAPAASPQEKTRSDHRLWPTRGHRLQQEDCTIARRPACLSGMERASSENRIVATPAGQPISSEISRSRTSEIG
jgi:hypothetical protein